MESLGILRSRNFTLKSLTVEGFGFYPSIGHSSVRSTIQKGFGGCFPMRTGGELYRFGGTASVSTVLHPEMAAHSQL